MRAALWTEPGKPMQIGEVDDPKPAPHELVLKVEGCGICGSDLHAADIPSMPPGSVMGHEFSGEVVEVGSAAKTLGDVITAIDQTRIRTVEQLAEALAATKPGQAVEIAIKREGVDKKLTTTLGHRQLELIRPEHETKPVQVVKPGDHDPL